MYDDRHIHDARRQRFKYLQLVQGTTQIVLLVMSVHRQQNLNTKCYTKSFQCCHRFTIYIFIPNMLVLLMTGYARFEVLRVAPLKVKVFWCVVR